MSIPSLIHSAAPAAGESVGSRNERELVLVHRARKGDRAALKVLWDEYRLPLYHFFSRNIASREEAEDLTSETLLALFRSISTFRGYSSEAKFKPATSEGGAEACAPTYVECSFNSFVFSIATNQLRQWLRRKNIRDQRILAASHAPLMQEGAESDSDEWRAAGASADPLNSLLRREHLDSACYALAGVGTRSCEQFKALLLHYACGLTHRDIASLLGTRKETVNTRLQEGRLTLKAHYNSLPEA